MVAPEIKKVCLECKKELDRYSRLRCLGCQKMVCIVCYGDPRRHEKRCQLLRTIRYGSKVCPPAS